MSNLAVSSEARELCVELERLAADRTQILETMRSLDKMEERLRSKMESMEQDLLDLLNVDDSESMDVQDIGRLRIILQRRDQYNSKPYFEVRYPDYNGVFTRVHFLRKPGNKRKKGKS